MKLSELKQIIKEEIGRAIDEIYDPADYDPTGDYDDPREEKVVKAINETEETLQAMLPGLKIERADDSPYMVEIILHDFDVYLEQRGKDFDALREKLNASLKDKLQKKGISVESVNFGEINGDFFVKVEFPILMEKKEKPSAGMTAAEKSKLVKKAKAGGDIGKKGKGFEKVKKAAEKGGARDPEAVAAAAMWKQAAKKARK